MASVSFENTVLQKKRVNMDAVRNVEVVVRCKEREGCLKISTVCFPCALRCIDLSGFAATMIKILNDYYAKALLTVHGRILG